MALRDKYLTFVVGNICNDSDHKLNSKAMQEAVVNKINCIDILLDYLFKNSKQAIHYRHKTNSISFKIINIVYCKTRWESMPVFVCDI